jgi:hypothetical protein
MVWASLYPTESGGAMERSIGALRWAWRIVAFRATVLKGAGLSGRSRTAEIAKDPPLLGRYAARWGFSLPGSAAAAADC